MIEHKLYSRITVTWFDPLDMYRSTVEIVDDVELIKLYGINEITVTTYGCTSKDQAQKCGLFILRNQHQHPNRGEINARR